MPKNCSSHGPKCRCGGEMSPRRHSFVAHTPSGPAHTPVSAQSLTFKKVLASKICCHSTHTHVSDPSLTLKTFLAAEIWTHSTHTHVSDIHSHSKPKSVGHEPDRSHSLDQGQWLGPVELKSCQKIAPPMVRNVGVAAKCRHAVTHSSLTLRQDPLTPP